MQFTPRRARLAANTGACSFEGRPACVAAFSPQMRKRAPSGNTRCPSLARMKPAFPAGACNRKETSAGNWPPAGHSTENGSRATTEKAAEALVEDCSLPRTAPDTAASPRISKTKSKRAVELTGANRPPLPKALASKCQLDPSEVKALNSLSSSGPRFKTLRQEIVVEQGQPCPAYECHLIAVDDYRAGGTK